MRRRVLIAAGVLVAAAATGCATTTSNWVATATQIRATDEGGMVLLSPGIAPQAAARDALAIMEAHCGGEYEIIEIAPMDLSRALPPLPPRTTYYDGVITYPVMPVATVYGTSFLYRCRKPEDAGRNRAVEAFASQDFLGKICSSDLDCAFYKCTRNTEPPPAMTCTAADGSIPIAREGESCDAKPCMAPLKCLKRGSSHWCVNP